MHVEICRPTELGQSEMDLWHSYQTQDRRLSSPFLAPEFALAADRNRRDVRLAVVQDNGKAVAFFAYTYAGAGLARPVAPGLSDAQAVVHDPSYPLDMTELIKRAGLIGWSFDHLVAFQAPRSSSTQISHSWTVDLAGGWTSGLEHGKASRRRSLREWQRKLRRLERNQGPVECHVGTGAGETFAHVVELKRAQCHRNGWRDILAAPWVADMTRELAESNAFALTGVVSALVAGGQIVSAEFGMRSPEIYTCWFSGYDIGYSTQSPGSLLWYHLFSHLAQEGVRYVDLGKGLTEAKRRFHTGSVEIAEGFVAREGPVGACAASVVSAVQRGRRRFPGAEHAARRGAQQMRRLWYSSATASPNTKGGEGGQNSLSIDMTGMERSTCGPV